MTTSTPVTVAFIKGACMSFVVGKVNSFPSVTTTGFFIQVASQTVLIGSQTKSLFGFLLHPLLATSEPEAPQKDTQL